LQPSSCAATSSQTAGAGGSLAQPTKLDVSETTMAAARRCFMALAYCNAEASHRRLKVTYCQELSADVSRVAPILASAGWLQRGV